MTLSLFYTKPKLFRINIGAYQLLKSLSCKPRLTYHKSSYLYTFYIIGLFARGNSHIIRLAVPLQLLFDVFEEEQEENGNFMDTITNLGERETSSQDSAVADNDEDEPHVIHSQAIRAAHSIVNVCLQHCCKFSQKYLF